MRRGGVVLLGIAATLGGCAGDDREWMKLNEKYTTEEFRRDLKSCTRKGDKVDEACMKRLGWVSVSPGREAKPTEPYAPVDQNRPRPR
jgi:hypothetical protein